LERIERHFTVVSWEPLHRHPSLHHISRNKHHEISTRLGTSRQKNSSRFPGVLDTLVKQTTRVCLPNIFCANKTTVTNDNIDFSKM